MPRTQSRAHLGDLLDLPVVAAPEFANWRRTPEGPQRRPSERTDDHDPSGGSSSSAATGAASTLSEAEYRFLDVVCRHPSEPSSEYAKRAGIGHRRAAQIRARLRDLGYVREHTVNLKSRGRPAIVIEPLAPAFELCGRPSADVSGATS